MMNSILAVSAQVEPERGWGGPVALVVGAIGCYLMFRIDQWWKARHGGVDPSPTEPAAPLPRETRRSDASRLTSHAGETEGAEVQKEWWGAISRDPSGAGRRIYRTAKHIAQTGESPPPDDEWVDEDDGEQAPVRDDFDDALEIVADREAPAIAESEAPTIADHEARDDEADGEGTELEEPEVFIRRCLDEGVERAKIRDALIAHYRISRAEAYRDIAAIAGPAAPAPRRKVA